MTNKTTNTPPLKVKCVDDDYVHLTVGEEYVVIELDDGFYKVEDDFGGFWWYCDNRFEIVETPSKGKQEFSVGDKVADNNPLDYPLLSHQEVVQAVIDGKELEIQYEDGTWHRMLSTITTLRQLTTLNFRLKTEPSLEDKRKAVIKKLLTTKVAVLCKCWDDHEGGAEIMAVISVNRDTNLMYTYNVHKNIFKNAFAIDDNGNEITNVE